MRVWVLGSGSRGNAVLLECGASRVLVDAGFPPRVLAERLAQITVPPASIEAVILTHEHSDHGRGVVASARRWGWSVYATPGTTTAFPELDGATALSCTDTNSVAGFEVTAVPVPHDAAEPVAIVATDPSGARAAVAYDLGAATNALRAALRDLDVLVLEANHDSEMLRCGPYPACVRDRIAGRRGHLSNRVAALLAAECAHVGLGHVVLAHLSESCNDAVLAADVVGAALARTRYRGPVRVATQEHVAGPFAPRTSRPRAVQLGLALY